MRVSPRSAAVTLHEFFADRPWVAAFAVAFALVFLRNAVFLIYEQSFFDSDQAIFGLMAKHLAEGRAFPLFCYGQTYMLAVDAWVAAPIFLLVGPSVPALHMSLVLANLLAVSLLLAGFRASGLSAVDGCVATLFFSFAPPLTAAPLIEAAAGIGPFVYIPLLWMLRRRPLWFGVVLGLGFLSREFTIYAVPVLLLMEAWTGEIFTRTRVRHWLLAAASTLATWQVVEALKPYSDLMGPGTRGELIGGYAGSQIGNIADRVSIAPQEFPMRVWAMLTEHLPRLFDTEFVSNAIATQGHPWLMWPLTVTLVAAAARGIWLAIAAWRRERGSPAPSGARPRPRVDFCIFILGVGLTAVAAYVVTRPADRVVDRYLLLSLYIPIGVIALLFALERRVWIRRGATLIVFAVAVGSGVDHARQFARYWGGKQPDQMRMLADGLVERHITVAMANYWRAYKLTFLSGERVKIASSDVVRIEEYQRLADAAGPRLVTIQDSPCADGERVAGWYLCRDHE